jgi:hypothetical protein
MNVDKQPSKTLTSIDATAPGTSDPLESSAAGPPASPITPIDTPAQLTLEVSASPKQTVKPADRDESETSSPKTPKLRRPVQQQVRGVASPQKTPAAQRKEKQRENKKRREQQLDE